MKSEKILKAHNLIFLCIITTIVIITMSFSKYESTVAGNNVTKVALMANSVSMDINLPISGYPGMEFVICPIVITNKIEDKICEVSQKYTIEIETQENLNIPLTFELYKDQYCTEIMGCDENGIYSEDEFFFNAGVEDEQIYYLKIDWPEDANSEYLAFEIEYFSVNVVATQVD